MKQEDSLSGGPCSPSSRVSSTSPSSHCSSRPVSPASVGITTQHRAGSRNTAEPLPSIDFRIPDLETSLITEECIDDSEFDQYLPPAASGMTVFQPTPSRSHVRHTYEEDTENNNSIHKNKKQSSTSEPVTSPPDLYNYEDVSLMRYHEMQPSDAYVKSERYPPANPVSMYNYQNSVPLNSTSGYYTSNGQYLPNYQYLSHQRPIFSNTGSYVVNGTPAPTPNDNWKNFV